MLNTLASLAQKKGYWLAFMLVAVGFVLIALYYQYYLEYMPCVLCVHVRIIVLGMVMMSALAIFLSRSRISLLMIQIIMVIFFAFLLERSYQLLGVERGFIMGDCSMSSGLPSWFALDKWFPSVFKVWEPCGYTPEIVSGLTMAEALIVISLLMLIFSLAMLWSMLIRKT